MNIGSTPKHIFIVPNDIDITNYREIQIVYSQAGKKIIIKNSLFNEIEVSNNNLIVSLSQEDTFKVNPNRDIKIQVRIMLADGEVIASNHITVSALKCLDSRILGNE